MYADSYSEEITRKLSKLKKKDAKHYQNVRKKMDWILENPQHRYKDLHYDLKSIKRIHIGHFVLTFIIDSNTRVVSFEDYDHHDKIYY
mgnify:CR=1 FL=1